MQRSNILSFGDIAKAFGNHSYLFLFIPLIIVVYPLIPSGVVMFGDYPFLETSLHPEKFLSTWIDYGSHYGFETLPRYPFLLFAYLLNSLQLGSDIISKLLVILGFSAASFSFYFSSIYFMKNYVTSHTTLYRIGAVIGSLYYAYNVWSFHRIHHWYLWVGYAVLPLFLLSLYYAFKRPDRWKYVVATVLLWSIASSTPHMAIFYGLFFLAFSLYFLICNIKNKSHLMKIGISSLSIICFYLLVNLYWLYPPVLYTLSAQVGALLPSIHVTEEMTEILSRDNNFLNVLRLIEDWISPKVVEVSPPQSSLLYPFWVVSSFVLPTIAFSALLLKRYHKYIILFSCISIIGILLTLGTNGPFRLYSILLFELPVFSITPYIFRDPDKWAFMIALSYSFLLSIVSFEILKKLQNLKNIQIKHILTGSFISFILVSLVIYAYPIYTETSKKLLDPVNLPVEYEKLNEYLTTSNIGKVFYLFQDYGPTQWNNGREVCCVDQKLSSKPNIMNYLIPTSQNYHDYIKNSIQNNNTNNIKNLIYPLGTSNIIYSNDELIQVNNISKELSLVKDFKNIQNIGFFNVFKVGERDNEELNIPGSNVALVGGLDLFSTLNSIPSFSSINTSLSFLDQNLNKPQKYYLTNITDYMAISKYQNDYVFNFLDDKYVLAPIDATAHDYPEIMWSKSATGDPENANYQRILQDFGIENWDFDYGRGLVITSAIGANLSIPIDLGNYDEIGKERDGNFHLFMRFLKNQKGGEVRIYFDDKLINEIDTSDRISNNFVWQKIGSVNSIKGKHTLTLENVFGLNAVNIFAILPTSQIDELNKESTELLQETSRILYPMEAESGFYNNKGKETGSYQTLFLNDSVSIFTDKNNSTTEITSEKITGQFEVPPNTDLVAFQFPTNKVDKVVSPLRLDKIEITPAQVKNPILFSNFEKTYNAINTLDHFGWINQNKDLQALSYLSNGNLIGNNILKVNISQGTFSYWGTISTDFIPVNDSNYYTYTLDVSADEVNQLHAKVYYYDFLKKEISSEFIVGGKDGNFKQRFNGSIIPQIGTKYMKLQIWVAPNSQVVSSYILENLRLQELEKYDWIDYDKDILTTSFESNTPLSGNKSLRVDIKPGTLSRWGTISTDFIPVTDIGYYTYSLDVSAIDVNQLHGKVFFYDSNKIQVGENYIFDGIDGSFVKKLSGVILPPFGTKFMILEIWVTSNPNIQSSYLLDNVKLEETLPSQIVTDVSTSGHLGTKYHNLTQIENTYLNNTELMSGITYDTDNISSETQMSVANSTEHSMLETKSFPVEQNHVYNYSIVVDRRDIDSNYVIASFRTSDDVVQNVSRYGSNASKNVVLSLDAGSEINRRLDIIKPSNYTIAIRAKTCETCTFLKVGLEEINEKSTDSKVTRTGEIILKDYTSNLKWVSSNETYLKQGSYDLKIHADSQTEIDSVIIYENNPKDPANTSKIQVGTLKLFNQELESQPAYISGYKKIDSTRYMISITNATKPYILSFAESFDPLWIAHSDNNNGEDINESFKTNSFPLYSVVNGFLIDKTGDYNLIIEYQPQKWFAEAGTVSIMALASLLIIYFITTRWIHFRKLATTIKSLK